MTRNITNIIRFVLDSFLPPILRDNKYFMYPMFYVWYKGKNVSKLMNFKENLETITEEEFVDFYKTYDAITSRPTDLNKESIAFILEHLGDNKNASIIDIGCGNGYLLSMLKEKGFTNLMGCDIVNSMTDKSIPFVEGNIENLPFDENAFDIVLCNHCIEHIINSYKAVGEIKRVGKEKVILNTPRQLYFRYTFDLHVNFYPQKIDLLSLMNMENYECIDNNGDWSYVGYFK